MPKAEISWKRLTVDNVKLQVYVHHVGARWKFYVRERRYDCWEQVEDPPLEDWLALLNAVERRVQRRLIRPEEVARLRKTIRERFPEVQLA
jgi:hypothetical protein